MLQLHANEASLIGQKMVKERIRSDIFESFSHSKKPASENIVVGRSLEAARIEEYFSSRSWKDVTLLDIRACYRGDPAACLLFMTPVALSYFIPAFMLMCIDSIESADILIDTTIQRLNAEDETYLGNSTFTAWTQELDRPRRKAIAGFLRGYGTIAPAYAVAAKGALDSFWSTSD